MARCAAHSDGWGGASPTPRAPQKTKHTEAASGARGGKGAIATTKVSAGVGRAESEELEAAEEARDQVFDTEGESLM